MNTAYIHFYNISYMQKKKKNVILSDRQLIPTHLFAWKYKDIQKAHWGQVKKSGIYGLVLRQEIRQLPSPPEKSD